VSAGGQIFNRHSHLAIPPYLFALFFALRISDFAFSASANYASASAQSKILRVDTISKQPVGSWLILSHASAA